MVTVRRTPEFLEHKGTKGMKWGYNDGQRNGRRTATELKKVAEEFNKINDGGITSNGDDVEQNYHEANNMLRYLGITLDLQSDDKAAAQTIALYNQMKNTKDKYKTQYDWLKAFSNRLASIGYDMNAVTKMLDEKKDELNKMETGTGSGNTAKSNQDWQDNTKKKSSSKKKSSKSTDEDDESDTKSTSKSKSKSEKSKDKTETKTTTKSTSSTPAKKTVTRKTSAEIAEANKKKSTTTRKSYSYRPKTSYAGAKKYPSRSKVVKHDEIIQNGEELYHHGILGQRWGVRRFQNADGSLTSAGKKRYSSNYSDMSDDELRYQVKRKRLENRYKDLKVGSKSSSGELVNQTVDTASKISKIASGKKSTATKTTNAVGNVAKDASRIADKVNDAKVKNEKKKIDLSNMSTDELQKAVNRMQLEQDMAQLDGADVARGKKIATDTLQTAGLVASTAVDVITLALLVKQLKK